MNLYLIRHGEPEPALIGNKDYNRKLTGKGKKEVRIAANNWKKIIYNFDRIISSPLIRAKETAEIIFDVFNNKGELLIDQTIAPGCSSEKIIELVNAFNVDNIACVGHQPDLSEILSDLVSSNYFSVEFKPAAIAKISFNGKIKTIRGTLEYLITPKILI